MHVRWCLTLTDNTLQIRSQVLVECNFICSSSIKMKSFFGKDILKIFMTGIPLCDLCYLETVLFAKHLCALWHFWLSEIISFKML